MALLTDDPNEVWVYFQTETAPAGEVPLPITMAQDICVSCRNLIPDTPAGCCWWCTWDLEPDQEERYRQLLLAYEAQVLASLAEDR